MSDNVRQWLKSAFSIHNIKKDEVNFPCPYCNHFSFYFNTKKKIGFCHRASCGKKPTLKDLVQIKGYGPSDFYTVQEETEVSSEKEVVIPGWGILAPVRDTWAIQALEHRGVTLDHISRWGIRANAYRIFVPVINENKIVQYVGRAINRNVDPRDGFSSPLQPKYKYADGAKITNFIFGWGPEMESWSYLVLVENTFNAIAWRDHFNCSTNFGSHLSERQIATIAKSRISKVIFAWDGDAANKAWNASKTLSRHGIASRIIVYNEIKANQPDQVPFWVLKRAINGAIVRTGFSGSLVIEVKG